MVTHLNSQLMGKELHNCWAPPRQWSPQRTVTGCPLGPTCTRGCDQRHLPSGESTILPFPKERKGEPPYT